MNQKMKKSNEFIRRCFELSYEFHEKLEIEINEPFNAKTLQLRKNLTLEECQETLTAINNDDNLELADGIADLIYVLAGNLVSFSNFDFNAEDFSKNDSQSTPNTTKETTKKIIAKLLLNINRKFEQLNLNDNTKDQIFTISCDFLKKIFLILDSINYPLLASVEEVHRSNMTKLWPLEDKRCLALLSQSKEDSKKVAFRHSKDRNHKVCYRISDGKAVKPPNFSKPNLIYFADIINSW